MTPDKFNNSANKSIFFVSAKIIWFSSLFMGILASVPKILQLHITAAELVMDAVIAFVFSISVWYFNIYGLPKFSNVQVTNRFFNLKLLYSLSTGIVFMLVFVVFHQLLFPKYDFQSMILMYQFRGILINLTICMFLYFLYQTYRNHQIEIELGNVKADHLSAQYELLKHQVNPHFLFNSLNTLKSMVEIDDEHISEFILNLSDFYRFTLEKRKQDLIPLADELNILHSYMFLLRARFEEGIIFDDQMSEQYATSLIPPFTLQLLVENCIKHNVVSLEQPLTISLYINDNMLHVKNNLQLKMTSDPSIQMGLENINERYQHLTRKNIAIEKNQDSFTVKLPLI
ncbi:sensor histidine kinase YesM [Pedobacter cryoconitis]|uniref:Sensor histidine kinase YesM n=2 Tax=Pedobacter cryoconitis TaxID=188932 RepID=A0A7W8ZMQ3_9SPHI|nr:histidine kinase [Pedobacter cryoconitis]MBB5636843.1 sensor histidine kinase YesM [Pedobacter cryoconitis]